MKRSEFLKRGLVISALGLSITTLISSCYKTEDPPAPPKGSGDCLANGTSSAIGGNHGHSLTVSKNDVQLGVEKSYDIQGGASHPHTVIITSSQFASLKSNNGVSVISTNNSGHTHSIAVSCA